MYLSIYFLSCLKMFRCQQSQELEHLLSESEPELLALLPERGGQQRVAAVEHRHLASVLLPQLCEHLGGDNIVTIVTIHWQYFTITEKAPISILA